ncbi:hypothetical protein [Flagellimonas eckloniae]|uniref:Uncharacterized protein n=1 Tax=Flagellimonas eckloniae TaxID=346185 RepID=A0A0Q1BKX2_9FLAO|nr:hypothetical protein [Allomuricauda eckloniae]KQC31336.1 hypothetical protein AAY42_16675 [Allomuricauda eckloniae]
MASIAINTIAHSSESLEIPKEIQILDSKFNKVKSFWIQGGDAQNVDLDNGMYAVVMTLPSGQKLEEVIEIKSGLNKTINFNLANLSNHETHEWAHLSNQIADTSKSLTDSKYLGSWIRLWCFQDNIWRLKHMNISEFSSWDEDGVSYKLEEVEQQLQFLQVGGPRIPWRFVALPPSNNVMCLIKPNNGPTKVEHPFEITVTSDNWQAEAILTLLRNNATAKAKEVFDTNNFAERLLYNKVSNPTAAAIGGYYLLKFEKFDQLHNWARNLANWSDWLPDGSIIWAWQLIKQGRRTGGFDVNEVRKRFLEASQRGLPIYTEGLRLLWEGLKMLCYTNRDDEELKSALDRIGKYAEAADWSATVTTFNGADFSSPSKKSGRGTPRDTSNLVYIYDVPSKVLVDATSLTSDDVIEVISEEESPTRLQVSGSRLVEPNTGKSYKSIYEAVKKIDNLKTSKNWNVRSSNIDLDSEIDRFRKGR